MPGLGKDRLPHPRDRGAGVELRRFTKRRNRPTLRGRQSDNLSFKEDGMTRRSMPPSFHANLFALAPARCPSSTCGVVLLRMRQMGTFLMCRYLGTLLAPACGLLADIVKSLAFSIPGGQKMPNMSTVAIAVSYRLYEIIDINENMFIYVDTYRTASGRFDQFEGLFRP